MANDNRGYSLSTLLGVSTILRLLKLKSRKLLLGSAGVAAVTLVLRYIFSKDAKFILELARVGRQIGSEFDEYDIIIVGGGMSSQR